MVQKNDKRLSQRILRALHGVLRSDRDAIATATPVSAPQVETPPVEVQVQQETTQQIEPQPIEIPHLDVAPETSEQPTKVIPKDKRLVEVDNEGGFAWVSMKSELKVNDGVKVKMRGNTLFMYCPGCKTIHCVETYQGERHPWKTVKTADGKQFNFGGEYSKDMGWWFNGDMVKPSLGVSVIDNSTGKRCHFFVEKGAILYCGDCQHEYAGHDVEMPCVDDWFKNPQLNVVERWYMKEKLDKRAEVSQQDIAEFGEW